MIRLTQSRNPKTNNMKPSKLLTAIAALTLASYALPLHADEKKHDHGHDHDHIEAGPNGGRVLHAVEPHLEFFVTEDRKVQISALNDEGKVIPIEAQSVKITAGDRSAPTILTFAKSGDTLVSDVALPEGNDFPLVIQLKATADAKAVIEKFNLNLEQCPTCKNKEYACTCDHAH
jgi:hypothetical protein